MCLYPNPSSFITNLSRRRFLFFLGNKWKWDPCFFSVSKIILLLLALTEQGTGLINFSSGSLVRENIPPGIESLLSLWVHSILWHLLHTPTLSGSIRMKQCNVVKVSKEVTDLNCGRSRWRRKMRWIKMWRKKCWRINQPDPLLTCKQNA